MKPRRILSIAGFATLALLGLPWGPAEAGEGATTAGYAFVAGFVVLGVGALGVLSLGISLRRYYRSRLGREPRRGDVRRWEWVFISCVPRPSWEAHDGGGEFDLHAGKRGYGGGGRDAGGGDGDGV